jgi:hypothetical protein
MLARLRLLASFTITVTLKLKSISNLHKLAIFRPFMKILTFGTMNVTNIMLVS